MRSDIIYIGSMNTSESPHVARAHFGGLTGDTSLRGFAAQEHGRLPGKLSSWPQTPLLASIAGVHDAVRVGHFRIRVECATRLAASAMVSWPSAQSCEGERVRRHRGTQSVADFEPLLLHGARPTREPPGACFRATPTPSCGPGSLLTTLNHFVPPTLTLESLFVNTIPKESKSQAYNRFPSTHN